MRNAFTILPKPLGASFEWPIRSRRVGGGDQIVACHLPIAVVDVDRRSREKRQGYAVERHADDGLAYQNMHKKGHPGNGMTFAII